MAVNSVAGAVAFPPSPLPSVQPESREATGNGKDIRPDKDVDGSAAMQQTPPPSTSPQGTMVGSLVDTKA